MGCYHGENRFVLAFRRNFSKDNKRPRKETEWTVGENDDITAE